MADGRIVIDTRINNKGAEADLRALQAKCKATGRELDDVGKELEKATGKRTQLADDLDAARRKAAETAQALEDVNTRLDAGYHSKFGQVSEKDVALSDSLSAKLQKQDARVEQITAAYQKQQAAVEGLTARRQALNAQLNRDTIAANRAADACARQVSIQKRLDRTSKAARLFGKRLLNLTTAAFVFNLLSKALRSVVSAMSTALLKTNSVKTAFSQLKGSAATAAAGLANALAPAITWLIQLATALLNVFIKLISVITGQSIGAMKKQGKAIASAGSAAKSAAKSLAAFDEINRLDDKSGGADFSAVGDIGAISARMKELAEQFKAGFKKGFGDAGEGLKNIKADLARIGAALKDIWTDPAVSAAVKRFANTCAYALGEVVGAAASVGVSIAENLVGGLARYLERSKGFLKQILANIFNLGSDLMGLFGDFAAAVATVFRSLGSEGAKQLTSGFIGILANSALGMIQTVEQIAYAIAKPLLQPFIDNADKIREVFSNLFAAIAPFFVGVADGLASFYTVAGELYNNVLKPLIDGLAAFNSGVLGALLDKLNAFLETLTGTSDLLHGIGEVVGWLGGALLTVFTTVKAGSLIFGALQTVATGVTGAFGALQGAAAALPAVIGALTSPFGIAVVAIGAVIAAGVALYTHWDDLKAAAGTLYDALHQYGQDLYDNMQTLKENIAASFEQIKQNLNDWGHSLQADWAAFWASLIAGIDEFLAGVKTNFANWCVDVQAELAALKNVFATIWNGIVSVVTGAISRIISGVLKMVERITDAINGVLSAIGSVGSRVSGGVSSAWSAIRGQSAPTLDALPVPALAAGAVIPPNHKFLAMLGDQTGGTNVEAPLDTIKQALAEVLTAQGGSAGQPISIYIGEELLDTVIANSESRRALRCGGH